MATQDEIIPTRWPARRYLLTGWLAIGLIFGLGGWWAHSYEIAGAVVAHGELRAKSQPKPVAHPVGGVVAAILTHEGARVAKGDVLIELEAVDAQAGHDILEAQINDLTAQAVRLRAERDEAAALVFPPDLIARSQASPELANTLRDQQAQFTAGAASLRERLTQFNERDGQLAREIQAARARIDGLLAQRASLAKDIAAQAALLQRGFAPASRLREMQRQQSGFDGEIAALQAEILRLERQRSETRAAAAQARADRREAATGRLQEAQSHITELIQRRRAAADALRKIEIRAPQDGVAQGLTVFAPGAVLGPGEPALTLIPANDPLVIETRIATNDRDRVYLNQPARVKFTAFNSRTTPEIPATVSRISADRQMDANSGAAWYSLELTLADDAAKRIGTAPNGQPHILAPGIPAEIFIATESRTVLSFLTRPLIDSVERAGRER